MVHANTVSFEQFDSYQKQTYRNRTYIYCANGRLSLNIPVQYSQKNRQFYQDVRIAHDGKWQLNHWKSLQSAYKTSPFFEFYEDALEPVFHKNCQYLMDYNFECLQALSLCLQWDFDFDRTKVFEKETSKVDLRFLINARKEELADLETYNQVFSPKHGFINNLSILDLLCNEGPNTLNYLQLQDVQKLLSY